MPFPTQNTTSRPSSNNEFSLGTVLDRSRKCLTSKGKMNRAIVNLWADDAHMASSWVAKTKAVSDAGMVVMIEWEVG